MTRSWKNLNYDELGSYNMGQFYSESFSGIQFEADLFYPDNLGREETKTIYGAVSPGGVQKTLRIITLLHESAHLVHDLSLGTCIELDCLKDASLALLLFILNNIPKGTKLSCPLSNKHNFNRLKGGTEFKGILNSIESKEALSNVLIGPSTSEASNGKILSGMALLEGLVVTKTQMAIFQRIRNEQSANYIKKIKRTLPLFPEQLSPIYNVARTIFNNNISKKFGWDERSHDDKWPQNYINSFRAIIDEGFVYLADLSLHIPPIEIVDKLIKSGKNQPDDFIPTKRFIKAIETVVKNNGFPERGKNDSKQTYYKTVFDCIAKENDWPSYYTTNRTLIEKILHIKNGRKEAIDGYRLRMLELKNSMPLNITWYNSLSACARIAIPILHLTPNGLKNVVLFPMRNNSYSINLGLEHRDLPVFSFIKNKLPLWTDDYEDQDSALSGEADKQMLFYQEVVYRRLGFSLMEAILFEDYYSCPFAEKACDVSSESCLKIKRLRDIPIKQCALKKYSEYRKIDTVNIVWD